MKPTALNIDPMMVNKAKELLYSIQQKLCAIWDNEALMEKVNRVCPDRIDDIWRLFDLLGSRVNLFQKGEIPFCDVRLKEIIRPSPGVKRKNPETCEWEQAYHRFTELEIRPDVWNTAVELDLLIDDLLAEINPRGANNG